MPGRKTHEQQLRIIEKREDTSNAGNEFNAKDELKRSRQEREAHRKGANLRDEKVDLVDEDNRQVIRGENHESQHHKHGGRGNS
ncbi:hypothetical protein [Aquamicrobium soli]|jgi:hypothetical protein|uniref:Uncharacterized protein n=1 Tax=Aquamicrobium soli TaxID=1811518 RepID=A0ABV7K5B8_9HYPH